MDNRSQLEDFILALMALRLEQNVPYDALLDASLNEVHLSWANPDDPEGPWLHATLSTIIGAQD